MALSYIAHLPLCPMHARDMHMTIQHVQMVNFVCHFKLYFEHSSLDDISQT